MKKIVLFLLLILFCIALVACNSGGGSESTEPEVIQADPGEDDTLNVLLIGNSFSCGFCEELACMLDAADIKANIYSVYFASCTTKMHWSWLQTGRAAYRLRLYAPSNIYVDNQDVNLEFCLSQQNWDVISLQQHFSPTVAQDYDTALEECTPSVEELLNYLRGKFPKSQLVWYETWTYELGWEGDGITIDQAFLEKSQNNICAVSEKLAQDNGIPLVPCGDAWAIARAIPNIGQLHRGDLCHDGTAGGQYLNACVWYEFLTGKSCLENTWLPGNNLGYMVLKAKTEQLRQAAHQAIADNPFPWNKGE